MVKSISDDVRCMEDYIAIHRYNTEKMFPVDRLKQLCDIEKPKHITGKFTYFFPILLNYL